DENHARGQPAARGQGRQRGQGEDHQGAGTGHEIQRPGEDEGDQPGDEDAEADEQGTGSGTPGRGDRLVDPGPHPLDGLSQRATACGAAAIRDTWRSTSSRLPAPAQATTGTPCSRSWPTVFSRSSFQSRPAAVAQSPLTGSGRSPGRVSMPTTNRPARANLAIIAAARVSSRGDSTTTNALLDTVWGPNASAER